MMGIFLYRLLSVKTRVYSCCSSYIHFCFDLYTTKIAKNASFELDFCIICYLWLWKELMKYIQNATYMAISLHFIRKIVARVTRIPDGKIEYPRLKTCPNAGTPGNPGYRIIYRDTKDGRTYCWWHMDGNLAKCEALARQVARYCEAIVPGISSRLEIHDCHICWCESQSILRRFGDDIGTQIIHAWSRANEDIIREYGR